MDLQESWEKALKQTEIVRGRVMPLKTFEETNIPYVFLSKSQVNAGDTVVRKGKILVDKPAILSPHQLPQLFGFDFDKLGVSENTVVNFFLLRGIRFPSLKYSNEPYALDLWEGNLSDARSTFASELHRKEDVETGLILGPDDTWPFPVLIFVAAMMDRAAGNDIRKIIERFKQP